MSKPTDSDKGEALAQHPLRGMHGRGMLTLFIADAVIVVFRAAGGAPILQQPKVKVGDHRGHRCEYAMLAQRTWTMRNLMQATFFTLLTRSNIWACGNGVDPVV